MASHLRKIHEARCHYEATRKRERERERERDRERERERERESEREKEIEIQSLIHYVMLQNLSSHLGCDSRGTIPLHHPSSFLPSSSPLP
jgi:hypothetical protein